jgi:hypothetical protein
MTVVVIGATSTVCLSGARSPLAVDHPEEVAVEVHRVVHHGSVDHDEPNRLPLTNTDGVLGRQR